MLSDSWKSPAGVRNKLLIHQPHTAQSHMQQLLKWCVKPARNTISSPKWSATWSLDQNGEYMAVLLYTTVFFQTTAQSISLHQTRGEVWGDQTCGAVSKCAGVNLVSCAWQLFLNCYLHVKCFCFNSFSPLVCSQEILSARIFTLVFIQTHNVKICHAFLFAKSSCLDDSLTFYR